MKEDKVLMEWNRTPSIDSINCLRAHSHHKLINCWLPTHSPIDCLFLFVLLGWLSCLFGFIDLLFSFLSLSPLVSLLAERWAGPAPLTHSKRGRGEKRKDQLIQPHNNQLHQSTSAWMGWLIESWVVVWLGCPAARTAAQFFAGLFSWGPLPVNSLLFFFQLILKEQKEKKRRSWMGWAGKKNESTQSIQK